jgi:16S rRNA (guanine1207-N2)-methyltransferase|tara:strand:- start:25967 stop:26998 length:1032 start_codon:yes stop_codon:yes gene_type:complete
MSDAATAFAKLIENGDITLNDEGRSFGVIAMQPCAEILPALNAYELTLWCPFYPWAKGLSQSFTTPLTQELPFTAHQDSVLVLPSKQMDETLYLIACALASLKEGGSLYVAAANDAGGNRLKKILAQFGLDTADSYSKNKCKILHAHVDKTDTAQLESYIKTGAVQEILDGAFVSQLGLYGWNKADIGSQLLCNNLPDDLHGLGADFGCGYGLLSRHILDTSPKVRMLCLIDAEQRALSLAEKNIVGHAAKTRRIWDDLCTPEHLPRNLDFVVMNPPFHNGKDAKSSLGVSFIKSAHQALKRYGQLYMVANAHLPYEHILDELFHKSEIIAKANGFKVIRAGK